MYFLILGVKGSPQEEWWYSYNSQQNRDSWAWGGGHIGAVTVSSDLGTGRRVVRLRCVRSQPFHSQIQEVLHSPNLPKEKCIGEWAYEWVYRWVYKLITIGSERVNQPVVVWACEQSALCRRNRIKIALKVACVNLSQVKNRESCKDARNMETVFAWFPTLPSPPRFAKGWLHLRRKLASSRFTRGSCLRLCLRRTCKPALRLPNNRELKQTRTATATRRTKKRLSVLPTSLQLCLFLS